MRILKAFNYMLAYITVTPRFPRFVQAQALCLQTRLFPAPPLKHVYNPVIDYKHPEG